MIGCSGFKIWPHGAVGCCIWGGLSVLAAPVDSRSHYILRGMVIDSVTGIGIPGVEVELAAGIKGSFYGPNSFAITDSMGIYAGEYIPHVGGALCTVLLSDLQAEVDNFYISFSHKEYQPKGIIVNATNFNYIPSFYPPKDTNKIPTVYLTPKEK